MKNILLAGIILLNACCVSAQQLQVKKEKKQLYLPHTVQASESLYSLGRMYHLTPKEIAAANKLNANAGLNIGQQLKMPLNKTNFAQSVTHPKKGWRPVYHFIVKGENLSVISKNYNNVKQELLKKWNHLSKPVVKPGQQIIVGYVFYSPAEIAVKEEAATASVKTVKPAITQMQAVTTAAEVKTHTSAGKEADNRSVSSDYLPVSASETEAGFFSTRFGMNAAGAQQKKFSGMAATFKSTSGWTDKKYYILVNDIPIETIVQITANGRTVYAKVLESLPTLKDNNGITCRISNAAASALGISDAKFNVELVYSE